MNWKWIMIGYLAISIILCEGLIFHGEKTGKGTKVNEYILLFIFWPLTTVLLILMTILRKLNETVRRR